MPGLLSLAVNDKLKCLVKSLLRESCEGFVYARVVRCVKHRNTIESWVRLCGDPMCIDKFISNSRVKRGVRVASVYGGRSNRFIRILF